MYHHGQPNGLPILALIHKSSLRKFGSKVLRGTGGLAFRGFLTSINLMSPTLVLFFLPFPGSWKSVMRLLIYSNAGT